jgi:hypothetical protein
MRLRAFVARGLVATCGISVAACGSSDTKGPHPPLESSSGSSRSGAGSAMASGGPANGSSAGGSETTSGGGSGSSAGSTSGSDASAGNDAGSGSDSDSAASSGSDDSGAGEGGDNGCVKGLVQPNEVVMLGDSYMDLGNVGPTLQKVAGATYRTYYLAGAALNYGGNGQFNIPYQFDSMAVPANPDIKVVITDGGGNDILIDNRQCLTTAVQGDTQCHMVIDAVVAKAKQLLQDMASKGVQHIVYMFYPHIDTTAIFTGTDANDWLDYVYPLAAQLCCGATTAPQGAPDLTCHGSPASGVDCTFIDTRPELAGHNDPNNKSTYWFDGLGIHPTQPGTDLIVAKMWAQMQKYCIAQ